MNFSDFVQMVSAGLRRGNTLDQYIPGQARLAMTWMETNYNFKYMEQLRLLQLAIGDRVIKLPDNENIKAMKFFRIVNTDGTYLYLRKVKAEDLTTVISTVNTVIGGTVPATVGTPNIVPTAYFQVSTDRLVINAITTVVFNCEVSYLGYSDTSGWKIGQTFNHPILTIAPHALVAQTLVNMAINIMKDMRMVQGYEKQRDEAVNTLTRAEDETNYGGEDTAMAYDPQYDLKLANQQPNR